MNLCYGMFCKFLGDFGVFLGENSFSQRICKITGNKKYWEFNEILKLEFVVNN